VVFGLCDKPSRCCGRSCEGDGTEGVKCGVVVGWWWFGQVRGRLSGADAW
jgi:hypothetical protein